MDNQVWKSLYIMGFLLILGILQREGWTDNIEEWEYLARLSSQTGIYKIPCNWDPWRGVKILISTLQKEKMYVIHLIPPRILVMFREQGKENPVNIPIYQYPEYLPKEAQQITFSLVIHPEHWWLYYQNYPLVKIPRLIEFPLALGIDKSSVIPSQKLIQFTKILPFVRSSAFMDEALMEKEEDPLKDWSTYGKAQWVIRSVRDEVLEQQSTNKQDRHPPDAQHSPNFYSLWGGGEPGVLVTGLPQQSNYEISASVQAGHAEAGVVGYYLPEQGGYVWVVEPMDPNDTHTELHCFFYHPDHERRLLARVKVPLLFGQWIQLKLRFFGNQLEGLMDRISMFRLRLPLPPGGQYGFFVYDPLARSQKKEKVTQIERGALFDDLLVQSVIKLPIENVGDLHYLTLEEEGGIFSWSPPLSWWDKLRGKKSELLNPPTQTHLFFPSTNSPKFLLFGSVDHPFHYLTVEFAPENIHATQVGIDFGFRGRNLPWYRFLAVPEQNQCRVIIQRVRYRTGAIQNLVSHVVSFPVPSPLKLTIDPGEKNVARFYLNEILATILPYEDPDTLKGANGIYVQSSGKVKVSLPSYQFAPELNLMNKFEKNEIFINDPYMRHWSSPEGEWVYNQDNAWYKSDYFGYCELNLPFVSGGRIYPGVSEAQPNGGVELILYTPQKIVLLVQGKEVHQVALPKEVTKDPLVLQQGKNVFAFCIEGQWLWLVSGGKLLFQHKLNFPLPGRGIRLTGFTQENLKGSYVRRNKVQDFLFTEALHDWTIHGGIWEVINRFACRPSWSHLNGENETGVASLWSKYRFSGDFCAEMYVGLRHGKWYNLPARDFNLTIYGDCKTPASGYTVTCSGWDPDETHVYTVAYKQGEPIQKTDVYTAPRVSAGNKRKLFESVIAKGRDVHGAWYYIKFRKEGNRFFYYFDNEKVLEWEDSQPLSSGLFGIWTYRTSMMVARVKVSADRIEPLPLSFQSLPLKGATSPIIPSHWRTTDLVKEKEEAGEPIISSSSSLFYLFPFQPGTVKAFIRESHGKITWIRTPDLPVMIFQNVLGGGSMAATIDTPPYPLKDVVGVRFLVKRLPNTYFNFYFTIGEVRGPNFIPLQRYIHRLTDSSAYPSDCLEWGTSIVPESPNLEDIHQGWKEVKIFFPIRNYGKNLSTVAVKLEGFGNLHPSYIQQGLKGNLPGSGYAVKDFQVIPYGELSKILNLFGDKGNLISKISLERDRVDHEQKSEKQGLINGLQMLNIRDFSSSLVYVFIEDFREAVSNLSIGWSSQPPYYLTIYNPNHLRSVLLAFVEFGKIPDSHWEEQSDGSLRLFYPPPYTQKVVPLLLRQGDRILLHQEIDLGALPYPVPPPMLLSLKELSTGIDLVRTYNSSLSFSSPLFHTALPFAYRYDTERGGYLFFQNKTADQRLLHTHLNFQPMNSSMYPLFQIDWKLPASAKISLRVNNKAIISLSEAENLDPQVLSTWISKVKTDEQWHTYWTRIDDKQVGTFNTPTEFILDRLELGSFRQFPQTGKYAWIMEDNITLGPAVSQHRSLQLAIQYISEVPISQIVYAFSPLPKSWDALTPDEQKALQWNTIQNPEKFEFIPPPSIQGIGYLFFRAWNLHQQSSAVTSLPILIDQLPIQPQYTFLSTEGVMDNGSLLKIYWTLQPNDATWTPSLQPGKASSFLEYQGVQIPIPSQWITFFRTSDREEYLTINWPAIVSPWLSLNPQDISHPRIFKISHLLDGAGNQSQPFEIVLPDTDQEKPLGPFLFSVTLPNEFCVPRLGNNLLWNNPMSSENPGFSLHPRQVAPSIQRSVRDLFYYLFGIHEQNRILLLQNQGRNQALVNYPFLSFLWRLVESGEDKLEKEKEKTTKKDVPMLQLSVITNYGTFSQDISVPKEANTQWQFVQLNLNQLVSQHSRRTNPIIRSINVSISQIQLVIVSSKLPVSFHLSHLFLHREVRKEDKLLIQAYDASGLDSFYRVEFLSPNGSLLAEKKIPITWEVPGSVVQCHPYLLSKELAPNTQGWLKIEIVDRKGYSSRPYYFPINFFKMDDPKN